MFAAFFNKVQPNILRTILLEGLLTAMLAPAIVWILGVGRSFGKTVKG